MGFCYQMSGGRKLLCCDVCGTAGGVRKQRCPAGYCPAVAVCPGCRANKETMARLRAYHVDNDCAGAAARFQAHQDAVAKAQADGAYTFCASVFTDSTQKNVRCWFRNAAGDEKQAVVPNRVRDELTTTTTYDELAWMTAVYHDCDDNAVPYTSDGALGHGWECGVCGTFLQAG